MGEIAVNQAHVVAEVTAAFVDYEAALLANDVETLTAAFWDSSLTVRYGTAEELYGAAEIAAWRAAATGVPGDRTLDRTAIVTFGEDTACVNTLFGRAGAEPQGRQSQTWIRRPEGWRIVAAHVSVRSV